MDNLVSVIVATYNRSDLILATLNSILNQTYKNLEVIVVDDGSTDNTADIIASIKDERISYIYQDNQGNNSAKNTGINHSTGKYITLVDSDDIILPEKIEKQVNILEANLEFDVCFTGTIWTDDNLNPIKKIPIKKTNGYFLYDLLLRNHLYNGSDALFRRSALQANHGFQDNVKSMTDWNFYLKLSIFSNFITIPEYLLLYRVHQNNMSNTVQKYQKSGFKILGRIFNTPYLKYININLKKKAYAFRHLYLAERYNDILDYSYSIRHLKRALKLSPNLIFNTRSLKLILKICINSIKGKNYAANKCMHT